MGVCYGCAMVLWVASRLVRRLSDCMMILTCVCCVCFCVCVCVCVCVVVVVEVPKLVGSDGNITCVLSVMNQNLVS